MVRRNLGSVAWVTACALALSACGSEEPAPEQEPQVRPPASGEVDPDRPHEHEDPIDAAHVLVVGPAGHLSHRLGHAIQAAAQRAGDPVALAPSASELDALYLVGWGVADAGIVPGNVLASSLHSVGRAAVEVVGGLAVTEEVHVVVPEASSVRSLADLQGKTVSAGRLGSGSDLAARALLLASGLDPVEGDVTLRHEAPADALRALTEGRADALVLLGHCDEVHGAARMRLVAIPPEDVGAVAEQEPGYVVLAGADEGHDVLAVRPWLVARPALTARLRALFGRGVDVLDVAPPETGQGPPMAFRAQAGDVVVAGGAAGGTYARVAEGLGRVLEQADVGAARAAATAGSFESFVLLATGQADLAIVQEDVLADALRTQAVAPLLARVRLLTPLYQEEVHLAVAAGGPTDLAGLKGATVAVGEAGSGALFTARRLLRLAGLRRGDLSGRAIGGARALDALRAGRVQAAFLVGGQPRPAVREARVSLAPIAQAEGYAETMITAEAYPWLGAPVPTVATRALLLCRRDLEAGQVEALVKALFANRQNLAATHPKWSELDPGALGEAARPGLKLHAGAQAAAGDLAPDSAPAW